MEDRKIALVTGANRGIGKEIARQLTDAGHTVWLTGRNRAAVEQAARELERNRGDMIPAVLDITSEDSISKAHDLIEHRHGRLDILVNNAAIRIEPYGRRPSEQPLELWRDTFETNLFGMVATTNRLLPLLHKSPSGRIVNVSSLLGSVTTHSDPSTYAYSDMFKSLPAYSASKSAVNSWTAHLAYELRDSPIKVNAVHPGYTKTDLNDGEGELDVTAGATTSVRMALLEVDGPSGTYVHMDQVIPW